MTGTVINSLRVFKRLYDLAFRKISSTSNKELYSWEAFAIASNKQRRVITILRFPRYTSGSHSKSFFGTLMLVSFLAVLIGGH